MIYYSLYRQCPQGTIPYRIIEGDTLYTIARKFNTTIESILAANPGINPQNLYGGLEICVPQRQSQSTVCPIGTSPYEVKRGDTLASIARRFNTTEQAIISANPNINPNRLVVGQNICVTEKSPHQSTCATLNTYVVREGDTFFSISRTFGVSIQALQTANPGINPSNLYDGLILCIPVAPTPYRIIVSIGPKVLDLYRLGRLVKSYPVATGKPNDIVPARTRMK